MIMKRVGDLKVGQLISGWSGRGADGTEIRRIASINEYGKTRGFEGYFQIQLDNAEITPAYAHFFEIAVHECGCVLCQ